MHGDALAAWLLVVVGVCVGLVALGAPGAAGAKEPLPGNLGNGLARLVSPPPAPSAGLGSGPRLVENRLAIRDSLGRVLVDVRLAPGAGLADTQQRLQGLGLQTVARDAQYRTGLLTGFVALDKVASVATAPGVGAVMQAVRARTHVGAVTSQGVQQERVDRLPRGVDGSGITVGVLSDSFDTAQFDVFGDPLADHAADDIASGDLPGAGNPLNPNPVVDVEDFDDPDVATDEGRGMLQIVHDVAPKAKLCFATAFISETEFANNIRKLADPASGCGADVIADDVSYFDEPMFEDGLVADAVDDVAAKGVHYFSSAGNEGEQQGYAAPSPVAPDSTDAAKAGPRPQRGRPEPVRRRLPRLRPGPRRRHRPDDAGRRRRVIRSSSGTTRSTRTGRVRQHPARRDRRAHGPMPRPPTFASTPSAGTAGSATRFFKTDYADPALSGVGSLILTVFRARRGDPPAADRDRKSPQQFAARLPVTGTYKVQARGQHPGHDHSRRPRG